MRNDVQVASRTAYISEALPQAARTRGGVLFDPTQDRWAYREGVRRLSIDLAVVPLSPEMIMSLKRVLLWYAENRSMSHLEGMYGQFLRFARHLAANADHVVEQITDVDLLNYKASLSADTAWYLGTLSGLLKKWYALGIPGVSAGAAGLLRELRNKGNAHGVAVLTMDPIVGPFTAIEQESLQSAVNDAFATGSLREDIYFLTWLLMATGARPAQYAALKVCDVLKDTLSQGQIAFTVRMPRVKQRNADSRELFKDRPLLRQIGVPLFEYAQRVRTEFIGKLERPDQAPLFPAPKCGSARSNQLSVMNITTRQTEYQDG